MRLAAILAALAFAGCAAPACRAQDARGDGVCNLVLGYRWNGARCEVVLGCECAGADCERLARTPDDATCRALACAARGDAGG